MVLGQGNSSAGIGILNSKGVSAPFERVFYAEFRYGESVQGYLRVGRVLLNGYAKLVRSHRPKIGIFSGEVDHSKGKPSWRIRLNPLKNHFIQQLSSVSIVVTFSKAAILRLAFALTLFPKSYPIKRRMLS